MRCNIVLSSRSSAQTGRSLLGHAKQGRGCSGPASMLPDGYVTVQSVRVVTGTILALVKLIPSRVVRPEYAKVGRSRWFPEASGRGYQAFVVASRSGSLLPP